MQQDSEFRGRTFWRYVKHRLEFKARYRLKEDIMSMYNLDEVLKNLRNTTDEVTHYALAEAGLWITATNGCVPWNAVSFKTKQGGYWTLKSGWAPWSKHNAQVLPEDLKQAANVEAAHYKFFLRDIDKMPEDMRKQFYNIRDHLDKQTAAEKRFEVFFADVELSLSAYGISPDEKSRKNLKAILKDSYGKFK